MQHPEDREPCSNGTLELAETHDTAVAGYPHSHAMHLAVYAYLGPLAC